MSIKEDKSSQFLNDGSKNEQCESLGTVPMESVEGKPTDPSFHPSLIVNDKEAGFGHLVTKKNDQDSTTGGTQLHEDVHPVKQTTPFEETDEPVVSNATGNILSAHETEEESVEKSTFVVGNVFGLLSSPPSPNEG